jgi:hypothetical protein
MRAPPLIFSVLLILLTLVYGLPQRSTNVRRANASISEASAAGDALIGNVGDAADTADSELVGDSSVEPYVSSPVGLPFPQDLFFDPTRRAELERRTERITKAFMHSWSNYKRLSLGHSSDELKPRTGKPENSRLDIGDYSRRKWLTRRHRNGWGVTAVDALSTAIIMNLTEPVNDIIKHIRTVNFSKSRTKQTVSLFETTIRYLGGMLSGYDLLNDPSRKGMVRNVWLLSRLLYSY